MKLRPDAQRILLQLATADVQRTGTQDLPEEEQYRQLIAERARLRDSHAASHMRAADTETELRRIDTDIAKLQRREKANIKGLGATLDQETRRDLEHDLISTRRRLEKLQQQRVEVERRIAAHNLNEGSAGAHSDELDEKIAAAKRALDAARDAADATQAEREAHIKSLRDQLPSEVLAEYDTQREDLGVGAALFTGRICRGCNVILAPNAIREIMAYPADELPSCPECGSLLIRES
ncbi:zinc ribbon domain-containing protein [Corynebacterium aquilae]|uniref:CT398-like coiled coil hairpin domain-containing protein n=1 Tax=Corynebacterium aquilae DSM 44791 TaxID=1431546 RepID=A0A1L7CHD0_9CORY|nr:hypothetical protein [Corynebacterium aquilae]APT85153.1 hypothetical protein CAQU_08795 [Corynebacterium aquilae DSM 44791]